MSAFDALRAAHAAGITLTLDGDSILLEAGAEPPQMLLEALASHKLAILTLLKPGADGWCASDWAAYFECRRLAASRRGVHERMRQHGRSNVAWSNG
jgi:hypothetical protein